MTPRPGPHRHDRREGEGYGGLQAPTRCVCEHHAGYLMRTGSIARADSRREGFDQRRVRAESNLTKSDQIAKSRGSEQSEPSLFLAERACSSRSQRWSVPGSNRRPPACKAGALPTELTPRGLDSSGIKGLLGLARTGRGYKNGLRGYNLAAERRHPPDCRSSAPPFKVTKAPMNNTTVPVESTWTDRVPDLASGGHHCYDDDPWH